MKLKLAIHILPALDITQVMNGQKEQVEHVLVSQNHLMKDVKNITCN